jgi:glucose uptake protein GlcU
MIKTILFALSVIFAILSIVFCFLFIDAKQKKAENENTYVIVAIVAFVLFSLTSGIAAIQSS